MLFGILHYPATPWSRDAGYCNF